MVDSYTKMKPDSFKLQLQAVLTTYYEDIKGVRCRRRQHSCPALRDARAGAAGACSGREEPAAPAPAPSPVGKAGAWGAKRKTTQADAKLVCLNLNRSNTWQQPDPAYRPASRAKKKAGPKGYISVHTLFNNVCTLYECM